MNIEYANQDKKAKGGDFPTPPNSPNPPYNDNDMKPEDYYVMFRDDTNRVPFPDAFAIFSCHSQENPPRVAELELVPLWNSTEKGLSNLYDLRTGKLVMSLKSGEKPANYNVCDVPIEKCDKQVLDFAKNCSILYNDVSGRKLNYKKEIFSLIGIFKADSDFYDFAKTSNGPEYWEALSYLKTPLDDKNNTSAFALKVFCDNSHAFKDFVEGEIQDTRNNVKGQERTQ